MDGGGRVCALESCQTMPRRREPQNTGRLVVGPWCYIILGDWPGTRIPQKLGRDGGCGRGWEDWQTSIMPWEVVCGFALQKPIRGRCNQRRDDSR